MFLADTHNHTKHFSPDAKMDIEEFIKAAKTRGLGAVCITEHYEYDNPDPEDDITTFDIDEYVNAFSKWKDKCPDDLKLLMGIEFGYQTHTAEVIDKIALSAPFDSVILSNHLFGNRDVYYGAGYQLPKIERHTQYIDKMTEMCTKCSNYDIAGHYDYINRYNPDPDERLLYSDCPDSFDRFFEVLISKEKCLEVNTRSIYKLSLKSDHDIMPDGQIIRRYLEMGGKLISLGSDSHTSDTFGVYFEETCEYLKSLGVNELFYYEGRKPVAYGI